MSTSPSNVSSATDIAAILVFDRSNRLAVRKLGSTLALAFSGDALAEAERRLESAFAAHTQPLEYFQATEDGRSYRVFLAQTSEPARDPEIAFRTLDELGRSPAALAAPLAALIAKLEPFLIDLPYLHLGENEFIYKFRPEKERNTSIYALDSAARELYESQLCLAIKALARQHERSAGSPVELDFGAVRYVIPSHFGFCLGVKNAIERAYETLAANPGKRVFMLSELIHNPFVNDDLLRRGLRYLQSDKGVPFTVDDKPASGAQGERLLWDTLQTDDIVIIPAFGATDDDKRRLVKKGIAVFQYDATCMLVEKVWKAARGFGREGYSVIIHGKHEHEETKATFSNTRRYAPAVIVRNIDEARLLASIIRTPDRAAAKAAFAEHFEGRHTDGFDVDKHLDRIAVVNQTTLLSNETLAIIDLLKDTYREKFGDDTRVGGSNRRDTLCYATQVNQDALSRALDLPLDAAFVIGGKNSSNTYQLFRLCEERLGSKAYFIQSEDAILSPSEVEHYVFPAKGAKSRAGGIERRKLWDDSSEGKRVLITGGASCPDGIIRKVLMRINTLFPPEKLRSMADVLAQLEKKS